MRLVKMRACPRCGSPAVAPIVYGLPGEELWREAAAGRVVLGGCVIRAGAPTRACTACGHEWGKWRERRRTG